MAEKPYNLVAGKPDQGKATPNYSEAKAVPKKDKAKAAHAGVSGQKAGKTKAELKAERRAKQVGK